MKNKYRCNIKLNIFHNFLLVYKPEGDLNRLSQNVLSGEGVARHVPVLLQKVQQLGRVGHPEGK